MPLEEVIRSMDEEPEMLERIPNAVGLRSKPVFFIGDDDTRYSGRFVGEVLEFDDPTDFFKLRGLKGWVYQ